MIDRDIFDELFVLELANNHWGDLQRGLRIVKEFSTVVRYNDVRAAIKLQFRDVENFVHPAWRERQDVRYIKKTLDTHLGWDSYATLVKAVRENGMIFPVSGSIAFTYWSTPLTSPLRGESGIVIIEIVL